MLVVPEILGHRHRRMPYPEPTAGWLVHLAEDHHHLREHAGCLHVAVELLAFATALADSTEDADALVVPDHVVDHFGKEHRLADSRAAEEPGLATSFERYEHVDDLDPRFEDLRLGRASRQRWRSTMHRTPLDVGQRRSAIDGVTKYVAHAR